MSEYKYSSNDESFLTPFLYKFFVKPLVNILPMGLPANIITLISNSCVLVAFFVAYFNYLNGTTNYYYLIPILFFCYIIGDCSDGMQARRTKTGSPLGEYFDHFLDSFVTGLITAVFILCFRVKSPVMIFLSFQLLYLGQIGTFWERLHDGVMRFFKFSTSESVIGISVLSAFYAFPFIQNINNNKLFLNLSIFELLVFAGYLGAGLTGVITILKTKKHDIKLALHVVLSSLIGAVLIWTVQSSILLYTLIITCYNAFFIASLLASTNEKTAIAYPDILVPLSCGLYFLLPERIFEIQLLQFAYLLIIILIRFFKFFKKYKHCWYWKNPKLEDN